MTLRAWIIEPRDSLIVRDGKPFGANIKQAASLDFPFPSTTTGGVRTRIGLDNNGIFNHPNPAELKNIEVRGSLLAEIDVEKNEIKEFYLPAPADCLIVQDQGQKIDKKGDFYRLFPMDFSDAFTNLKDGLLPVGITENFPKSKPYNDLKYWYWKRLVKWLDTGKNYSDQTLANFGVENLKKDARTHVAITPDLASRKDIDDPEGGLFSTRGLEFVLGSGKLTDAKKLALVVFVDEANSQKLENKGRLAPLGGERRLVSWREDKNQPGILSCPDSIKTRIENEKHCRLILFTPAYFTDGLPKSNDDYDIKAIACNRYQTVSGWDFEKNCPKPTRRLLPAGSVLFLDLQKNGNISDWIDKTWFHCIGDDAQARKDGFGLCVLGTWDGSCLKF